MELLLFCTVALQDIPDVPKDFGPMAQWVIGVLMAFLAAVVGWYVRREIVLAGIIKEKELAVATAQKEKADGIAAKDKELREERERHEKKLEEANERLVKAYEAFYAKLETLATEE